MRTKSNDIELDINLNTIGVCKMNKTMTTGRPVLTLPKNAEALRIQKLQDKWLGLTEEITLGAIEVAKQGKSAKEYVEALSILNELIGISNK